MRPVQTIDDVYPTLDELMMELRTAGQPRLAAMIGHRMYQVAWTARSELLKELQKLLAEALEADQLKLPHALRGQIERVLRVIRNFLHPEQK